MKKCLYLLGYRLFIWRKKVMNSNELTSALETVLRSEIVDCLRDVGKSRGSGFYIRFYILSWMMAHADRLVSVEDTARRTGCTREQVQLVWDTLRERGGLDEDDHGCVKIERMLQGFAERASETVSRDDIAGMISLTADEITDLKGRLGDSYQMAYHLAAEYKARLRREKKPIFITDWMLILKASHEHWVPSYMKQGMRSGTVVTDTAEDDGIEIIVDSDDSDESEENRELVLYV